MIVNIEKDDGSASRNLFALAASAKAGKVERSISTELNGVDAPEFTTDLPPSPLFLATPVGTIDVRTLANPAQTLPPLGVKQDSCVYWETKSSKNGIYALVVTGTPTQ
ncbi:hypothetical protein [Cupriavidus basilensis]|uniref:hypothetical protein n=1 Tax=Cupriavidus basilensis TaxID=68895 RepID=UPI0011476692|nr:hypothetical protein [Cupriavidus basilensis]